MLKKYACCFTGHRPHKLEFGYDEGNVRCLNLKKNLKLEIENMIDKGICLFLSGMANGTDLWAAEEVIRQKTEHPEKEILLIAVIPYRGQASAWAEQYRERYNKALECADQCVYISQNYNVSCIQKRNEYLVDHSTHMIAVYNGTPGGTRSTIMMAKKKNRSIVIIEP